MAPELRVCQPPPTMSHQAPSDSKEDLHLIILLSNLAGKVGEHRQLRKFLFVKQNFPERETVVYRQDFTVRKKLSKWLKRTLKCYLQKAKHHRQNVFCVRTKMLVGWYSMNYFKNKLPQLLLKRNKGVNTKPFQEFQDHVLHPTSVPRACTQHWGPPSYKVEPILQTVRHTIHT